MDIALKVQLHVTQFGFTLKNEKTVLQTNPVYENATFLEKNIFFQYSRLLANTLILVIFQIGNTFIVSR